MEKLFSPNTETFDILYFHMALFDLIVNVLCSFSFVCSGLSEDRSIEVWLSTETIAVQVSSSLPFSLLPTPYLQSSVWYIKIRGKLDPSDHIKFTYADVEYKMVRKYQQKFEIESNIANSF